MRAVVQRVSRAAITIGGKETGRIGKGLLILLGIHSADTDKAAEYLAQKCAGLRVFEDDAGKMNRSAGDIAGGLMVVSNFTLYGATSRGKRPSFTEAAHPEIAEPLYDRFVQELRRSGLSVEAGVFGADMEISLINDGPVTLIIDSEQKR